MLEFVQFSHLGLQAILNIKKLSLKYILSQVNIFLNKLFYSSLKLNKININNLIILFYNLKIEIQNNTYAIILLTCFRIIINWAITVG